MKKLSTLTFGLIVMIGVSCQSNKTTTETTTPAVDSAAATVTTMVDSMKMDSTAKAQMDTAKAAH